MNRANILSSLKGWDNEASKTPFERALGRLLSQPFRLKFILITIPKALPWAGLFQPFRLKNQFDLISGFFHCQWQKSFTSLPNGAT